MPRGWSKLRAQPDFIHKFIVRKLTTGHKFCRTSCSFLPFPSTHCSSQPFLKKAMLPWLAEAQRMSILFVMVIRNTAAHQQVPVGILHNMPGGENPQQGRHSEPPKSLSNDFMLGPGQTG